MGLDGARRRESGMTRTVRAGQVTLQVTESGHGIPLLLVHGFPLDHSMWRGQIEGLAGDCRVIAVDLRGFGGSEVSPGTVTMEQFADVAPALTHLDTMPDRLLARVRAAPDEHSARALWDEEIVAFRQSVSDYCCALVERMTANPS